MKISMEVDCTPQEARTLLGLPDLEPLQDAVLAQVEKRLMDAASAMSPEGILKMWFSLLPGSEQYLKTMTGFLRTPSRSTDAGDGEKKT